jgi:hypothetical protein
MWKCPDCGEQVANNFEICWNCGTTRDGVDRVNLDFPGEVEDDTQRTPDVVRAPVAPEKMLAQILQLQMQQQQALNDIQSKVGCLFVYMVVGILLLILGIIIGVIR